MVGFHVFFELTGGIEFSRLRGSCFWPIIVIVSTFDPAFHQISFYKNPRRTLDWTRSDSVRCLRLSKYLRTGLFLIRKGDFTNQMPPKQHLLRIKIGIQHGNKTSQTRSINRQDILGRNKIKPFHILESTPIDRSCHMAKSTWTNPHGYLPFFRF